MVVDETIEYIQLWFEIYLPFFVSSLMLLAMAVRFWQLNGAAKHALSKMNWVIKTRVTLILFVIINLTGLSFLSLYDGKFQFYEKKAGTVFAFEVTVMTAQIGSLFYEYTKNVPIMWPHKAYWLIQTLLDVVIFSTAIVGNAKNVNLNQNRKITNPELVIESLHFCSLVLLTGFSFFYRRQDISEYESGSCFALTPNTYLEDKKIALIPQNFASMNQFDQTLLKVIVGKDFIVQLDDFGQQELVVKLRVFNSDKSISYKLTKRLQDFIDLETCLLEETKFLPQNIIYPFKIPDDQNKLSFSGIGMVQSRTMVNNVNYLQSYMSTLTSKIEYYLPPLLDFLNVPYETRNLIEKERNKSLGSNEHGVEGLGESSNSIIQEENQNALMFAKQSRIAKSVVKPLVPLNEHPEEEKDNPSELQFSKKNKLISQSQMDEELLNYFEVQIIKERSKDKHREYEIIIKDLKVSRKWTISKRFRDFKALNEQLKETLNLQKMPPLPKKNFKFLLDEKELNLRKQGLENYLKIILNEKMYFTQQLFDFINLKPSDAQHLTSSVASDIEKIAEFQAISIGPSEMIDGKDQYTTYRYKIMVPYTTRNQEHIMIESSKVIQKRYTDFSTLHEALKIHFQGTYTQVPELPPKYSHFGTHTTIAFRDSGFQSYLNALFRIPLILDCVHFRIFIQWQQFTQIPSHSEPSQLQSIHIPNLSNGGRTTSECMNSLIKNDLQQLQQLEELENQFQSKSPGNDKGAFYQL